MQYMIIFKAINNDTYHEINCTLHHSADGQILFDTLPNDEQLEKRIKLTYDGVWEPQMDSVQILTISNITDWKK